MSFFSHIREVTVSTYSANEIVNCNKLMNSILAAYTGARTIQRHSIVQLGQHIFRTSNSLRLMTFSEKEDQAEPDYVTKDLSMLRDEKQFEERLIPLLKAGLQKYYAEVEEDHDKSHETKVSFLCGYSFEVGQSLISSLLKCVLLMSSASLIKFTLRHILLH